MVWIAPSFFSSWFWALISWSYHKHTLRICWSAAKSCPTLCHSMDCSMPGFPVLHCLLEFAQIMSTGLVMPSNHLIFCHPFLLLPLNLPSWPLYQLLNLASCFFLSISSFSLSFILDLRAMILIPDVVEIIWGFFTYWCWDCTPTPRTLMWLVWGVAQYGRVFNVSWS